MMFAGLLWLAALTNPVGIYESREGVSVFCQEEGKDVWVPLYRVIVREDLGRQGWFSVRWHDCRGHLWLGCMKFECPGHAVESRIQWWFQPKGAIADGWHLVRIGG